MICKLPTCYVFPISFYIYLNRNFSVGLIQKRTSKIIFSKNKQSISVEFDRCDRPSYRIRIGFKSFFSPYDHEIWWMTSKNNRVPLLCYVDLCASFQSHWWIQTRVTKLNSVLCDLDLWTLTETLTFWRTALLSMATTPENSMMIRWQEHWQKCVTDGQTEGLTDWTIHNRAAGRS